MQPGSQKGCIAGVVSCGSSFKQTSDLLTAKQAKYLHVGQKKSSYMFKNINYI